MKYNAVQYYNSIHIVQYTNIIRYRMQEIHENVVITKKSVDFQMRRLKTYVTQPAVTMAAERKMAALCVSVRLDMLLLT